MRMLTCMVLLWRSMQLTLVALILLPLALHADDNTVDFDADIAFASFHTFSLKDGKIDSPRPEVNNSLRYECVEKSDPR